MRQPGQKFNFKRRLEKALQKALLNDCTMTVWGQPTGKDNADTGEVEVLVKVTNLDNLISVWVKNSLDSAQFANVVARVMDNLIRADNAEKLTIPLGDEMARTTYTIYIVGANIEEAKLLDM